MKDLGQEDKGATEDKMVGGHQRFRKATSEDSEGQGSLACLGPGGRKELDMTQ